MKRFIALIGVFIAAILQVSFLPHFSTRGFLPSIIMVVVFCWCLLGDYQEAFFWAIGGGVLLDIFSSVKLSVFMISLLVIVLSLYLISNTAISFNKYYTRTWLCGLIAILYYGLIYFFSWLFSFISFAETGIGLSTTVFWSILLGTVANVLLMLIIYPLIAKYQKIINGFATSLASKL
ncbi:hypothetical protein KJ903_00725 [Patescibacteria group bacterium]|nr:hypothetical protein [Patescibacteria group bacterium]